MTLPQTNAQLLAVAGAGGAGNAEAYDGPAAAGAQKWAGQADAYLRERRDRLRQARGEDRAMIRELILDTEDPDIDWRSGDVVTYRRDGDDQDTTVAVKTVERRELDGAGQQTTRLTLEEQ